MKKQIMIIYLLCACFLSSCGDTKYASLADEPAPITALELQARNGDLVIDWTLPAVASGARVQVNDTSYEYDADVTSMEIENATVNREYIVTAKAIYGDGRVSEGVTKRLTIEGLDPVENLKAERSGDETIISWTLPADNAATAIDVIWGEDSTVALDGNSTSYTIHGLSSTRSVRIGVRTRNSGLSSHYVYIDVRSQKIAYILTVDSPEEIVDDDEQASYDWFVATFPEDGDILTPAQVAGEDLSVYSVIWLHIDREGLPLGADFLPEAIINDLVVLALTDYLQNHGSLLLTNHATQYITLLERLSSDRSPNIFGSGAGGTGDDVWTFNANLGMIYDHSSHPMYEGLSTVTDFGHPSIPLIGPGHREDHNCMWDLNAFSYSSAGDNTVQKFENENQASVIATWGHVTDFCCAGIIEFLPTQEFTGRCVAIGLAAYEWNQNSGSNIYQGQIERLTLNTINYLKQ